MFRNRKCYCMNNSYQNDSCQMQDDMMEKQCDNVASYEDMTDDCECGFDEERDVFPELVSPYMPGQSMEEIEYIKMTNKIGKGCNKCQ